MSPELHQRCARAVHVITSDGRTLRAGRAVLHILRHNGWGWFARMLALPPLVWGVELGYWIVARNRRLFARFMFRKEPSGPAEDPNAC
jgi:predicted DCC family thiol-disulfide oxidoreductase YuxK